jgi:hypothetical membrane protein
MAMSNSKNAVYKRMGASSGIVAPILAFACILIAIVSYPQFSWANNALSDLGIIKGITGPIFDFGLFASGLLAFNFAAFGLYIYFGKSVVGKTGAVVFATASISLMAIGVFNENFSPTHYAVSVAFFTLTPIAMLIVAGAFWLKHGRKMAAFTIAAGVAAALPWVLLFAFNYVPNVAIPEFASGLVASVWAIAVGWKMLKT